MSKPLRALIVEASEDDALLVIQALRDAGYEPHFERIETADTLQATLNRQTWDVVLSDYSLPNFNALAALAILKESGIDLPFIIISGTIGEDAAVASLKAGAHDFITKGNAARLIPAIERELHEVEIRRKRREAQEAIQHNEKRFRALIETNENAIALTSADGTTLYGSPAITRILGYTSDEWVGRNGFELVHPDDLGHVRRVFNESNKAAKRHEIRFRHRDGTYRWVAFVFNNMLDEPSVQAIVFNIQDITERKELQEQRELHTQAIEEIGQFLQTALDAFPDNSVVLDRDGTILYVNERWKRFNDDNEGRSATHYLGANYLTISHAASGSDSEEAADAAAGIQAVIEGRQDHFHLEYPCHSPTEKRWFEMRVTPFPEATPRRVVVAHVNTTEHNQLEIALLSYNKRLTMLHQMDQAILLEQSPEAVAQIALQYFLQNVTVWGASITPLNLETQEGTIFAAYSGSEKAWSTGTHFSLAGFGKEDFELLQQGKVVVVEDVMDLVELSPEMAAMRASGLRSYVAVPLMAHGELIGSFNLGADRPDAFTQEQITIASEVANILTIAFKQTRYREQIERHILDLEQRVLERTAELQRTTNRIEIILNSTNDAIILTTFDGIIQQVNPAFNALFGDTGHAVFGQSLITLTAPDSVDTLLAAIHTVVNEKRSLTIEIVARQNGGSLFDGEMALAPILEAHTIRGIVCSLRDISARKRIEAELHKALEKERELNALKTRFVAMVSHDFRTPLSVIRSSTDLLQSYYDRMDEMRRASHFNRIRTQIERMISLLNDVLNINRTDAGATLFRPVQINLDRFCRNLADEFQSDPNMKHRLVYSYSDGPTRVLVDEKLLLQAVINLFTNAFKYSPEGSTVYFDLAFDEANAVIRIKDGGIGIPEADQPRLFETFHRAGNVGEIEGTGLGLAIVKRSVEAHGGTIAFESRVGVGTTFIITLPLHPTKETTS